MTVTSLRLLAHFINQYRPDGRIAARGGAGGCAAGGDRGAFDGRRGGDGDAAAGGDPR